MNVRLGKRAFQRSCVGACLRWLSVAYILVALNPARADEVSCPDQAEVIVSYSVAPKPIDQLAFLGLYQDAKDVLNRTPHVEVTGATISAGLSVDDVAQAITAQAEVELESFGLERLLKATCGVGGPSNYLPNTCSLYPELEKEDFNLDSSTLQDLKIGVRQDIRSLPACLILQRTNPRSHIGYLLSSTFEQVQHGDANDYLSILNGLLSSEQLKADCENVQSGGCLLYLTMATVSSFLELRELKSSPQPLDLSPVDFPAILLAQLAYARCPASADGKPPSTICNTGDHPDSVVQDFVMRYSTATDLARNTLSVQNLAWLDHLYQHAQLLKDVEDKLGVLDKFGNKTTDDQSRIKELESLRRRSLQRIVSDLVDAMAESASSIAALYVNVDGGQNLQERQFLAVVSSIGEAEADIKSKNYVAAFSDIVPGLSGFDCTESKAHSTLVAGLDGGAFANCQFAFKLESFGQLNQPTIKFLASLAEHGDGTALKDDLAAVLSGTNASALMLTSRLFWAGAFIGGQGGYEFLSGSGYKVTGSDYALFAPLGVGFSWPRVLFGRPVAVYASVVDLGSLISTSNARPSSQTGGDPSTKSGWSQTLAPGIYGTTQFVGPIFGGLGYAYRTPSLRQATLSSGQTVNLSSSRIEVFVSVNVPFLAIPW